MNRTQNDLSMDEVTLDYQAMLATSKIAYSHCIERISKYIGELRAINPSYLPFLSAQWLAREAEQLVVAAETMHTLDAGQSRSQLKVVNKPELKEF